MLASGPTMPIAPTSAAQPQSWGGPLPYTLSALPSTPAFSRARIEAGSSAASASRQRIAQRHRSRGRCTTGFRSGLCQLWVMYAPIASTTKRRWQSAAAPASGAALRRALAACRRCELKDSTTRRLGRCPYPSTVRLDDRTADRQPYSHPVGLGRVKCLERAFEALRRWSRPRISHRDKRAVGCIACAADQQLSLPFVHCAHCFNGVDDQVQQHLLQLNAIPLHHRQLLRESGLQCDAMPDNLVAGQGGGVEDHLVHVERVVARGYLFNEAADPSDDVARSIAVLDDTPESLPDFTHVGRLRANPTQGGLGRGDDRGDRLIDFVGNRRREVPHGADAVTGRKRQRASLLGFKQAHVFDRDHRLADDGLEQPDLFVVERPNLHPPY